MNFDHDAPPDAQQTKRVRLFDATPVDDALVATTLVLGWPGAKLGSRIKSSQNVTYSGELATGQKVIIRATATPGCLQRITDELAFLQFVEAAGVRACGPVEPGMRVSADGSTVVTVNRFAQGAPVAYAAWLWATDRTLIVEQGHWLAQLHAAAKAFLLEQPVIASRIQRWDDVHDGILKGASTPPIEEEPSTFGVLHGDLNPSNFFVNDSGRIDVFDFDQTQRGWFLYDLAQPIWAVRMARKGGIPGLTGDNAPLLDEAAFTTALCEGYGQPVNREGLEACVLLRREMYERFCRRAKAEGSLPPDMAAFIEHVVAAFDGGTL